MNDLGFLVEVLLAAALLVLVGWPLTRAWMNRWHTRRFLRRVNKTFGARQ